MARRGLGRQVAHLVCDDWRYRQPILLSTPKPKQTIRNAKSDYDDGPIEYTGEQPGGEHNSTESNANRAVKHAEEYFDFCDRLLCAGGKGSFERAIRAGTHALSYNCAATCEARHRKRL
jgi:hypothetical protein